MPYVYEELKNQLFSPKGIEILFKVKENAKKLISQSGCARAGELTSGCTGDSWLMLAAIDYLVETKEIYEIKYGECAGQHRIFALYAN